ncbi:MAG: phosphatidate cytidylyltransferase [Chitinophagaceae bacterium]|nr:phosphatidate cytidylyltransferase [Chitinophagaceae bacterium]
MAFNLQTFKTRALTAVIFAAVMLAGLFWNHWSFFILFSVIHFGCWWEYLRLIEKIKRINFHPYTRLGFMLIGYSLMLWFCSPEYRIGEYAIKDNFLLPVSAVGFVLLIIGIFQRNPVTLKTFGLAAIGVLYISLSCGLMIDLYGQPDIHVHDTMYVLAEYFLPVVIIVAIWINDTMAYIVGSLIGKTPLSSISPKKTWEGTIGGILLSIGVVGLISYYALDLGKLTVHLVVIAVIASITGTFGDLLESKLKRMAGVKDSGRMMPGHGGFLDRFDSLLIAIPAVWVYVYFFMERSSA